MIEMILLYKWVFVLLIVSAFCLSHLGVHLVPRQQSYNSLMLTQVSSFGVLFGMLLTEELGLIGSAQFFTPLSVALVLTIFISALVERFRKDIGENFTLVIFLLFMSLSYWICSYFPSLDSHHADSYFGDIVTIQGRELIFSILGFSFGSLYLVLKRKKLMNRSFELEIFGKQVRKKSSDHLWPVAVLLMVLGIFSLGMLYTLSFMLMAPVLLAYKSHDLKSYLWKLSTVSILSSILGFVMSLHFARISTVPTVVITLFLFCLILMMLRFVKLRMS